MRINGRILYQGFKYSVYVLLTVNIGLFLAEEFLAAKLQFPDGVEALRIIEAYASTIDTAVWVILLLMFELETFVLEDRHLTKTVSRTLHALRGVCYVFLVYALYGYIGNVVFVYETSSLAGVNNLCALVNDGWSYAIDLDEYTAITAENCATFTGLDRFQQFNGLPAVVDLPGLADIRGLAWVDLINAGVWLLILVVLEIDVRLQEKNRLEGMALAVSNALKSVFYSILVLAVVFWAVKGDFVDWWDALLWIVAFVFIELNVFEWRQEMRESGPTDTA